MKLHVRHLSHKEATSAILVLFFGFVVLEIFAEHHFLVETRDVLPTAAVVVTWFKEFLHIVIERFAEEI